ncbi:hypothetical protein [Bradyrhizobium cosmicum]|uniref:hypothetical protein n=1 Tax=Bradyrhizobium cosmicum TaxID=1404864 RepID=UPI0028EA1211|nr:hypothetical protein [Bradyrhizobium cosmicum]
MRKIVATTEPDPAELRRLSVILRKHLIEKSLMQVASPRIGRLRLQALDLSKFYSYGRKHPYKLFCVANVQVYGVRIFAIAATHGPELTDADVDAKVNLSIDSFCKQRVFCVEGQRWITRADAIKFVAYLLDGAHPARPAKTEEEAVLEYIRRSIRYSRDPSGNLLVNFNTTPLTRQRSAETYSPTEFDPTLAELLCTAKLITESDDVRRLEISIREELGLVPVIRSAPQQT